MQDFVGERVLMRIHVGESDKYRGKLVFEAIVELLQRRGYAGATVLQSIMGFGARHQLHSQMSEYTGYDVPVVVECIETEARIDSVLPELDQMIGSGVVTLEKVRVIMYRADVPEAERTASWPVDTAGGG